MRPDRAVVDVQSGFAANGTGYRYAGIEPAIHYSSQCLTKLARWQALAVHFAHSMPLESNQGVTFHAAGFQLIEPAEVRQVDDKCGADHLAAGTADELCGRVGSTAGSDQVVDDEDALTVADGILVDFDGVDAVLERVLLPDGLPRQFTLFTNRDESAAEP